MGGCVVCRYEWVCCYLYTSSFVYGSSSSHGWAVKAVIRERGLKIEELTGTSPAGLNASMWAFVYAFVSVCLCVCVCVCVHDEAASEPVCESMCQPMRLLCPACEILPPQTNKNLVAVTLAHQAGELWIRRSCSRRPLISEQLVALVYTEICGAAFFVLY